MSELMNISNGVPFTTLKERTGMVVILEILLKVGDKLSGVRKSLKVDVCGITHGKN